MASDDPSTPNQRMFIGQAVESVDRGVVSKDQIFMARRPDSPYLVQGIDIEFVHVDLYNAALDALRAAVPVLENETPWTPAKNALAKARAVLAGEHAPSPSFLDLPDTPPDDGTNVMEAKGDVGPVPGPSVDFKD